MRISWYWITGETRRSRQIETFFSRNVWAKSLKASGTTFLQVLESQEFASKVEVAAAQSAVLSTAANCSFWSQLRAVVAELCERRYRFDLLRQRDLEDFDFADRGRLAKAVRFWSEHVVRDDTSAIALGE